MRQRIFGVGNELRGDDGVGLVVARAAAQRLSAHDVEYLEIGADPLALLAELERTDAAVIVDAADMGEEPGAIMALCARDAVRAVRTDPLLCHGFGLKDVLSIAQEIGILPERTRIVGIQPLSFEGQGLSPEVRGRLDQYVETTCNEVLGHEEEDSRR